MDVQRALESLVTFRLGQQVYALPIGSVVQIVEMVSVTPIPQVNYSVEGVINYHGKAIPAVNLRRHLGLATVPLGLDTHIIVGNSDDRTVGLLVDEVLSVKELPGAQIAHPGEILPEGLGEAPFFGGIVQTTGGIVFVLDLEHLFVGQPAQQFQEVMDALVQAAAEDVPEDADLELETEA
jgi:purine-binding chemotaxis protein CheW